jgi:hypothetical protein
VKVPRHAFSVLAAAAVLAISIWQWGSYGPYEITVLTPGRMLEQVVVELAFVRTSGEGTRSTYRKLRVGRSNEPIRFPRGFVCLCLHAPPLVYFPVHPAFLGSWGTVPADAMRHIGVTRAPPQPVGSWQQAVRDYEGTMSALHPGDNPEDAQRRRDRDLGSMFETFLRKLELQYLPHAHLSAADSAAYMEEVRLQLMSLPLSPEYKERLQGRVNALAAALRARDEK